MLDNIENVIYGNTIDKDGLEELKNRIVEIFSLGELQNKDLTYVSNSRQLALIEKVKNSIENALSGLENGLPVDIIEVDIANARKSLSEILGEIYDEELIDELFSRFCLGK